MQFIGIGFKKSDQVNLESIRDQAANYDLLTSKMVSEGNFKEGLDDFAAHFELDVLQFSAYNEDDRKASSRQISDELSAFHRDAEKNSFLEFLATEKTVLPGTYYVIFACDWHKPDPVRLERIKSEDLNSYFKRNNSWYLWLYNYSAKRYYPKLDLPLVLEIENHIGT